MRPAIVRGTLYVHASIYQLTGVLFGITNTRELTSVIEFSGQINAIHDDAIPHDFEYICQTNCFETL